VWIAGVSYAHAHAPTGLTTTAQGIFSAMVFGFGAATGSYIGAVLIADFSARWMYTLIGAGILVSLVILQLFERKLAPKPT
jgi:MFS family permease